MTQAERIALIKTLYDGAYVEKKGEHNSISGVYITINDQEKIGEWTLSTNTLFSDNAFTICCLNMSYLSYGWQRFYLVFAMLNKAGEIVNRIPGSKWTIEEITFREMREPGKPLPQITISLNASPSETISFKFLNSSFQNVWDFFLEVNKFCNTVSEAYILHQYFESKTTNKTQAKTIEEYKNELKEKNNIINQYNSLLEDIRNLVTLNT